MTKACWAALSDVGVVRCGWV